MEDNSAKPTYKTNVLFSLNAKVKEDVFILAIWSGAKFKKYPEVLELLAGTKNEE